MSCWNRIKIVIFFVCLVFILTMGNTSRCLAGEAIIGKAKIPKEAFIRLIYAYNQNPKLNCSIEKFVQIYYQEAEKENIRADVALSQALLETGFLRFGNDVLPEQNNFCGLGTVGNGARGCYFGTLEIGVRAHIQHLLAYATLLEPEDEVVDPRFWLVRSLGGYVTDINGLASRWAADENYAVKLESVLERARALA